MLKRHQAVVGSAEHALPCACGSRKHDIPGEFGNSGESCRAADTSLAVLSPKEGKQRCVEGAALSSGSSIIAAEWEEMKPGMLSGEVRAGGWCHTQVRTRCSLARDKKPNAI